MFNVKMVDYSYEHLSDVCILVASGWGTTLSNVCDQIDRLENEKEWAAPNVLGLLRKANKGSPLPKRFQHQIRSGSLTKAMLNRDFRSNFKDFLEHYSSIPFHSIYLEYPQKEIKNKGPSFLGRFFGDLDTIASKTLDIYFRPEDLLKQTVSSELGPPYRPDTWWLVAESAGPRVERELSRLRESSLLVWDHRFRPAFVPLGRFESSAKIAAIATLVSGLEGSLSVSKAARIAATNPWSDAGKAALYRPIVGPDLVREWVKELRTRHIQYPNRGYDEVARTLERLLLPSIPGRIFANTRLRLAVGVLLGAITLIDHAEVVIQVPEAWRTVVNWVEGSDSALKQCLPDPGRPSGIGHYTRPAHPPLSETTAGRPPTNERSDKASKGSKPFIPDHADERQATAP